MATFFKHACARLLALIVFEGALAPGAADSSTVQVPPPPTAAIAVAAIYKSPASPINVIFDTDMDSDCDDAGAMAVLHALADRGEARVLATISSSKNEWTAPCVEAINAWYGRAELPIGAPHGKAPASKSAFTRCGGNLPAYAQENL